MNYDEEKEKDTAELAEPLESDAEEGIDEDDDVPETDDFEERDY